MFFSSRSSSSTVAFSFFPFFQIFIFLFLERLNLFERGFILRVRTLGEKITILLFSNGDGDGDGDGDGEIKTWKWIYWKDILELSTRITKGTDPVELFLFRDKRACAFLFLFLYSILFLGVDTIYGLGLGLGHDALILFSSTYSYLLSPICFSTSFFLRNKQLLRVLLIMNDTDKEAKVVVVVQIQLESKDSSFSVISSTFRDIYTVLYYTSGQFSRM